MTYIRWILLCTGLFLGTCKVFFGEEGRTYHSNALTHDVETMYVRGIHYLVRTQNHKGYWQDNQGRNPGVVGMALTAILAHGDDPNSGPYRKNVKLCIDFILSKVNKKNGFIGSTMYHHGFATLALAEAYGHVHDDRIGKALRRSVDLILEAQKANPQKGWRYQANSQYADTTVSGANLVALLAARNAGIFIPQKSIEDALKYYTSCQSPVTGAIGYTSPQPEAPNTTAIGTLVFALAKKKDSRAYKAAYEKMRQNGYLAANNHYFYYLYYAAQAFFHGPSEGWEAWNKRNISRLKKIQATDGSWSGSLGKAYTTAAALLSLALNYRYLPIYER